MTAVGVTAKNKVKIMLCIDLKKLGTVRKKNTWQIFPGNVLQLIFHNLAVGKRRIFLESGVIDTRKKN